MPCNPRRDGQNDGVAARRQALENPGRRTRIAGIILVAALLAGMAVSWKLWLTGRHFPHFPCFAWFGPWPAPWDRLLAGG
ncbi:MAG: hypothetical protein HKO57_08780, partial [Akkermansiaceae bacterium]|nr:hypothetical protein [Akkermansiaceae bacterium]